VAQQIDNADKSMDDIMALCKRRGFIYPASEIYGGIQGFWDYGPLGAQLKKNLRDAWWHDVVMTGCNGATGPDGAPIEIVPLDSCIIQNPKVWEASGHVAGFNDPMVDDKETKQRFRADHLIGLWLSPMNLDTHTALGKIQTIERGDDLGLVQATVIASSPGEAMSILADGKKHPGVPGQVTGFRTEAVGVDVICLLTVLVNGQEHTGVLCQIPLSSLLNSFQEIPSPFTGKKGSLTPPRAFNLMFDSVTGPVRDEANKVYLRPETAQGIFINFKNVVDTTRVGVPFGIAQTGKAFRNEVTPRNFTFRSREFEQMEIEFFCHPADAEKWYAFWRDWRMAWWQRIGLAGTNLILREHERDELAHYAKDGAGTSDVEYKFPFTAPGYGELEGVAHRSDFDLKAHHNHPDSNTKLDYFDPTRGEPLPNGQPKGERYFPHVIEPSAGLDRGVLALLCEAYTPDPDRPSKVFMRFHPRMSPIKAAVFPLVKKDGMPEKATALYTELRARFGGLGFIEYDEKQSIGKRYARMDEAGCPVCFTIDGETLTDGTITVRDRDTASQSRIPMTEAASHLEQILAK